MKTKYNIKQILLSNQNWWHFYCQYQQKIRMAIVISILKLLSCKHEIRGRKEYHCTNPQCTHVKYVPHTCKSKACSSCGKKATEVWIKKQMALLPNTRWQHITFTMPCELWDFFWYNRSLLNVIGQLAADTVLSIARQKKLKPGIFIAIHTFGRDLKRNVHIHLSVTLGGLTQDFTEWKKLYFKQETLMKMWRYRLITLLRKLYKKGQLTIPHKLSTQFNHTFTLSHLLDQLYKKYWNVHCAPPSNSHKRNIEYLGRYTKRPAIANSKIKHFDGNRVGFKFLDHTTMTYRQFNLPVEHFIARLIQHIPDIGFRMIRYYGFLAHRLRGKQLPIVLALLQQTTIAFATPTYTQLIEQDFGVNPLICILCGSPMVLAGCTYGQANTMHLLQKHRELALLKKC